MISHPCYAVEPWGLRETALDLGMLAQSESVFALSNGHIGWRGNLEEGEPHGLPGTYLNGVHELHDLPYAEAGYGYPESGQTVVNVTNGKIVRLLVDDEPFDLRYGRLHSHERVLDLRSGLLHRTCEWTSPAGRRVRVRSSRLVSLTQRSVAAIVYEVEPLECDVRVVVQSELVANEELPQSGGDPRTAKALRSPLESLEHAAEGSRLRLLHRTRRSGLRVAAAAGHEVSGPEGTRLRSESSADLARLTVTSALGAGQRLRLEKLVAYGWSATRTLPGLRDQVDAALAAADSTRWQGLAAEQRRYLDSFWSRADIEVDGDEEIQQAIRFATFHVLQAGARAEERALPAKGLTGSGYDGHTFWDTESFVLPMLTYTEPSAVQAALRWRRSTLPAARERAAQLGLRGAAFPWRTIEGGECSAYWPAGSAAFHVNADIADAVVRYVSATGDEDFDQDCGLELLVETARMWRSLGHHDHRGRFHIDGVTGPDEYTAVKNDNTYTNLMAAANLTAAADAVARHPGRAARLGVDDDEATAWRDAADAVHVPYSRELRVHEQHEGFTRLETWDFDGTGPGRYPLLLHFPYYDLYRKQVIKQADLVLAMYTRGEFFAPEQKARNFAYYEPLTVRDSSLSACSQAIMAAEVGHLGLAYQYLHEAALMDLEDLEKNTRDGLHMASLAGAWTALVAGFGGMRPQGDCLRFAPGLPEAISRLAFRLEVRGRRLRVEIEHPRVSYTLLDGAPLELWHFDEPVTVSTGLPRSFRLERRPHRPPPGQPPGREPRSHDRNAGPTRSGRAPAV